MSHVQYYAAEYEACLMWIRQHKTLASLMPLHANNNKRPLSTRQLCGLQFGPVLGSLS